MDKEAQKLVYQVAQYLNQKGQKLATAESCTGGYIAHELTNIQEASEWFKGGIISYSIPSKIDILNVSESLLQTKGAVQKEVALAMAEGVKSLLKTDWSLSITGYLDTGPEKGRVYAGVVGPKFQEVETTVVEGLNRESLKYQSMLFSLKFLLSKLNLKGGSHE